MYQRCGLLNKIFHSTILVCHDDNPLCAYRETGAPPLWKPQDHHRANTFYTSLDNKVLAEIEIWLNGNDQDVLCPLGDITPNDSPSSDSFDLVARYYNLDRELLLAGQRVRFSQFKTAHVEKSIKTAAELVETLHENRLSCVLSSFMALKSLPTVLTRLFINIFGQCFGKKLFLLTSF